MWPLLFYSWNYSIWNCLYCWTYEQKLSSVLQLPHGSNSALLQRGRNVGSIRFKYYLAVVLVASRYLFLMPQCPQGILSRKVLATCLPVPGETGMGCWLSTHCYIPVSTTTRETKQSSSELPFELFVTLKLTKYSETQSLFYREQHLSARQGARTETCRTVCELLHVRGRNLCSFNT